MNEREYFKKFGWRSNPFTFTISPDLMVGYGEQSNALLQHVFNDHKFALISGPTGAGKTTILLWLRAQLKAYRRFLPIYVPKPPRNVEELVDLLVSFVGKGLLEKILRRKITQYNISEFLSSKLKGKRLVLLVDEAHEASLEVLEWLRTITDNVDSMCLVLAGLPVLKDVLNRNLPTLLMRITTEVSLNSLNRIEVEEMIRKRIDKVGGDGIKPFTTDAIDEIYRHTGGFPREVLKLCDKLVKEAVKSNITTITAGFVSSVAGGSSTLSEEKMILSKKQLRILEILNLGGAMTPSQIVEKLGQDEYKDKSNAVRAVNNILKRLLNEGLVERKRLGNAYVYSLSGKAKTLFVEA